MRFYINSLISKPSFIASLVGLNHIKPGTFLLSLKTAEQEFRENGGI